MEIEQKIALQIDIMDGCTNDRVIGMIVVFQIVQRLWKDIDRQPHPRIARQRVERDRDHLPVD